jgi:hypothetical protein
MIVIAVLALTFFHPGICFPQLAGQQRSKAPPDLESLDESDAGLQEKKIQEESKPAQVSTIKE